MASKGKPVIGRSTGSWKSMSMNTSHYHSEGMLVFSLNSHPDLADKISTHLGAPLAPINCSKFKNRETKVNVEVSVRGKDCYVIQSGAGENEDVNDYLMELLITCYAMKTASASRIVGIMPYLPYSKQSKMRKRGSIPSKLIANLMCRAGLDTIITMDLHSKEIQGFYDFPIENLRASPFLIQYIQQQVPDYRNAIIVAKNPQSAARATSFAERLRLGLAVIHGESKETESDLCDGRQSPPPASDTPHIFQFSVDDSLIGHVPPFQTKEKPPMNIVGDVGGKIAIIVDDIIDDAQPFVNAAALLKERGAYKILVMATHGLLSEDAPEIIERSDIDEIVVTNTVAHEEKKTRCSKIKTVDISMMLSEAVRRIHNGESMGYLFRDIPLED